MSEDVGRVEHRDEIDPAWWQTALPPTTIAADENEGSPDDEPGWEPPEHVAADLVALAEAAPRDTLQREALGALADAASPLPNPGDWAEPFSPFATLLDGRRTLLPSDFEQGEIALLGKLAPLIDNLPMRARAADIGWAYGGRSDLELLGVAIDAYLATPLTASAWHSISGTSWERAAMIMERRGSAVQGRRGAAATRLLSRIETGSAAEGFMLADLAVLYLRLAPKSPEVRRRLAERFVELAAAAGNPRLGRRLERSAHRIWGLLGESDETSAATARIAALYVREADERVSADPGGELAAGLDLERAIEALRGLPRKYRLAHGLDIHMNILRERLADCRQATLESMTAFETDPIDISSLARSARLEVAGRAPLEALARLASIAPLTEEVQALTNAGEALQRSISRIFGRQTLTGAGQKVAASSGTTSAPDDAELWSGVVREFDLRVEFIVHGCVVPALDVVTFEHRYDMAALMNVCLESPTVPPGHEYLWSRGLLHGLNSDFPSAIALLVPQAEHLLRHHLKRAGVNTLLVEPKTGIETEKSLGALLEMTASRAFLGPDLQLELRALLVEQEGANLRNQLAHGLLSDRSAWSGHAVYAWWLLLRMVVVPLWVTMKESVGINGDESARPEEASTAPAENEPWVDETPAGFSGADPASHDTE